MIRKKQIIYAILILIVSAICIKEALEVSDFKAFLEAAKLIRDGENPYNKWIFISEGNSCLYFYSPLWAILLIPFTYFPDFVPNIIWLAANVFFLYRIWILLKSYIDLGDISSKQLNLILLLTALMSLRFILYNFEMLQMTIFLLWCILESMHLFDENRVISGGILLALAINIKILPVVIIPYLIYRHYFKAAISVTFFGISFLLLPALILGWKENMFLLTEWWSVINPVNSEHLIESELGPHSLTALVPPLLTETQGKIEMSRNFVSLGPETAILVLNIIRVFFVVLAMYFLKWPPFKKTESRLFQLHELAYILLLIPLIFPHQQKYAYALAIPVMFYLSHFVVFNSPYRINAKGKIRWYSVVSVMGLSFALMTLSTDGIIGKELNQVAQHFKIITWGALLLIIALIMASPQITSNTKRLQLKNE